MAKPLVSVLVAVHNAELWLETAIESLFNQSLSDIEILAVDDASTDDSLSLLESLALKDERLHVIHLEQNQGQAVARNVALRHAQGEYVCMLDADDWFSTDALESAVEVFAKYPDVDSVVFRLVKQYANGKEEPYQKNGVELDISSAVITGEEAFRLSLDWTLHGLYMVRRELHMRYPYDETYRLYSDDNTTRLHYLHSRKVAFCKGTYNYLQHAQSSTTAITPQRFLHMMANLVMKQTLIDEGVSSDIISLYEKYRWQNYVGLLWFYFTYSHCFTPAERMQIKGQLRLVYGTFHRSLPYAVLYAEQKLRWFTKRFR